MGSIILKQNAEDDFYIVWSSIVDAPTYWGPRATIEAAYSEASPDRFDRADATGTSAYGGELGRDTTNPLWVREGIYDLPEKAHAAIVARDRLRELCETADGLGIFHLKPGQFEYLMYDEDAG